MHWNPRGIKLADALMLMCCISHVMSYAAADVPVPSSIVLGPGITPQTSPIHRPSSEIHSRHGGIGSLDSARLKRAHDGEPLRPAMTRVSLAAWQKQTSCSAAALMVVNKS